MLDKVESRDVEQRSKLTLADGAIAATVASALLLVGAWRMVPGVTGVFHDDGIYVAAAKALAEGQGYRLINLPDAPAQTKYPILYPLLLSAIWRLWPAFPQNVVIMQWATLALGAAALGLAAAYAIRFGYVGRLGALATGLIAATSPELSFFCVITMAEMPFALATVAVLWRLEHSLSAEPSRASACATGALLALPFLTRSIGAALIVAGLALIAWRGRRIGWVALGSLGLASPWIAWSLGGYGLFADTVPTGYYTDYGGVWQAFAGGHLAAVLTTNVVLLSAATGAHFVPAVGSLGDTKFQALALLGSLVLLLGSTVWACIAIGCSRNRVLPVALASYAAIVIVWPWPPARFLVPVLPLLLIVALWSAKQLARRQSRNPWLRGGAVLLAVVIVGTNLAILHSWNAQSARLGYPRLGSANVPDWAAFERLFDHVRSETQESDVIAAGFDSMLFLYTGRRSIRVFPYRPDALYYGTHRAPVGTPDEFVERLRRYRIRHVVSTPLYLFAEDQPVAELTSVLLEKGTLAPLYMEGEGRSRFGVFELVEASPHSSRDPSGY